MQCEALIADGYWGLSRGVSFVIGVDSGREHGPSVFVSRHANANVFKLPASIFSALSVTALKKLVVIA